MSITNEIMEIIYNNFETVCIQENAEAIESFIKEFNIDVNYDDGYYMQLICKRNDLNLLRIFINHNGNVHINNECLLRIACHKGQFEIIEYLLKHCRSNYKVLYETTAYSNIPETKLYIDNYLRT